MSKKIRVLQKKLKKAYKLHKQFALEATRYPYGNIPSYNAEKIAVMERHIHFIQNDITTAKREEDCITASTGNKKHHWFPSMLRHAQ